MRIGSNTRLLAVLGDPIAHSLSPTMHNAALDALGVDAVYVALRVSPGTFSDTFRALGALGLAGNVTVPHKEAAERDVTRKTDLCARAGACNTYWVEQGALVGDNTDVPAIAAELEELGVAGGRWLVIGTGGSARAVALAAADAHADLSVHSRDARRATDFAAWASGLGVNARVAKPPYTADVVVNATPLGLAPDDPLPIDPGAAGHPDRDRGVARQQRVAGQEDAAGAQGLGGVDGPLANHEPLRLGLHVPDLLVPVHEQHEPHRGAPRPQRAGLGLGTPAATRPGGRNVAATATAARPTTNELK